MLDQRYVSENLEAVKEALAKRGFSDDELLDRLTALAGERRRAIAAEEQLRQERNEASEAMAKIKDKKSAEFEERRASLRTVGDRVKELEASRARIEAELEALVLELPNLPHESTPLGRSETDNVEVKVWGEKPRFDFPPKDHVDIGTALGILDFDRAVKVSGARFTVLRGLGARLERALMQLMLDVHVDEHGYEEVWTPVLVKESALRGTGQLPKFEKDLFKIARHEALGAEGGPAHDLYLIPTAEVPVTNLHAGEILESSELPKAYTAYTACFRSEAGSYGRDTRGMIRQHQFDKVELVRFCRPEDGLAELEKLLGHACAILERLGLHYRVVHLCTGDMGFASQKTFDIEVWLPGQSAYREISSCSWFGDFQARRLEARYRPEAAEGRAGATPSTAAEGRAGATPSAGKAKPRLLHTLNGSGLAIGRTLVALLEQYQTSDGSVVVPEALRRYMGGIERLDPRG